MFAVIVVKADRSRATVFQTYDDVEHAQRTLRQLQSMGCDGEIRRFRRATLAPGSSVAIPRIQDST
jgi:hypothetical protein